MSWDWIFAGTLVFATSGLITRRVMLRAQDLGVIDKPNERSSHVLATPKGGGLVFSAVFSMAAFCLFTFVPPMRPYVSVMLIASPAVFVLGWWDDRFQLSASFRLFVHFFVATAVLLLLLVQFKLSLDLLFLPKTLWVVIPFALLFQAWFINLYNFMDGADGLAASVAVLGASVLGVLTYTEGAYAISLLYMLLACSVAGFLIFNWAPAKVFMGDSGSYFLGAFFSVMGLIGVAFDAFSLYPTVIIFGFFITDTTYTLIMRARRRQKLYHAHQEFGFHKLLARGWSHSRVALFHMLVQGVWLTPLAYLSLKMPAYAFGWLVLSYLPLLGFEVYIGAGKG